MAESALIPKDLPKTERYQLALQSAKALLEGETDQVARMSNLCALLHQNFNFLWTGFYLVKDDELVLGPFQGPVACMRIAKGKGVCGAVWERNESIVVPNVDEFPGHIACSADSRSEIVIPVRMNKEVVGVLDIDSSELNAFDESDRIGLEKIVMALFNSI